jgi:uncharacterized membrane protein
MTGSEFTPIAFGLASAALWGAGDFWGGWTSKRQSVYSVIVSSQIIGLLLFVMLAFASGERVPPPDDLMLSALGGLAGGLGIIALYRALAEGRMGVAAPVSAVVAAALPVPVSYVLDGAPKAEQFIGFGLALIAVWFISRSEGAQVRWRELGLPVIAGIGFGVFFIFIGHVSDHAVWWPLVTVRTVSLSTLLIVSTVQRQPRLVERRYWLLAALVGALEVGGNAFFALAGQTGRLDVAAVISSLYPATTVWLAWLILKERLSRPQLLGVAAALAAIVLITM